jgi:hypothetical protein
VTATGKPARTGRPALRRFLPVAVVLAVIGAGAVYVADAIHGAGRHASTVTWGEPVKQSADPASPTGRGRASTPRSRMLLPVPKDYRLGPEVQEHGNDFEFSGERASELMKRQGGDELSEQQRREFERVIDSLRVDGIAVRSYASAFDNFSVRIALMKVGNQQQARRLAESLHRAELEGAEKGPRIEGHQDARCFMEPEDPENLYLGIIKGISCTVSKGRLLVMAVITGPDPLDTANAIDLVKQQLDRIAPQGESV